MTNPWIHALGALVPDYDKIVASVARGPRIKCELDRVKKYTRLTLIEIWGNGTEEWKGNYKSEAFDDHIYWVTEQLANWPNVKRMAWDQWYFRSRKEAEKFVTFFQLKWS